LWLACNPVDDARWSGHDNWNISAVAINGIVGTGDRQARRVVSALSTVLLVSTVPDEIGAPGFRQVLTLFR
jgi:hypothetical protein